MENAILEFKRRKEIYDFISQNSGLHMREISRRINIPFTSLEYHLNYLEKNKLIISREDGKYNRFYLSCETSEKEKKILNCFRNRTVLSIILSFVIVVQTSQKDLSRFLEKHPATISFQLRKMIQADIIEQASIYDGEIRTTEPSIRIKRNQVSSEKIYVLKDLWMTYTLLRKHKDKLDDKELVGGIIEYVELNISEGIPKQIQNREETIESILETFYAIIFPPSFCS